MRDLNATMFFKAKFSIRAEGRGDLDLLWELVLLVRRWITRKYDRDGRTVISDDLPRWTAFKNGGRFFDEEGRGRIYAESACHTAAEDPARVSWACRIAERPPQREDEAPREWVTEIGYQATAPGRADISYVVTFSDQPGFIGLCSEVPPINVPNVVRMLLRHERISCYIGDDRLSLAPIQLRAGDFPRFSRVLLDPRRQVPVLYISPWPGDPQRPVLLSPQRLAESVAGNAVVYYSTDPEFSQEMMYMGDSRYTCTGGAIRLYRPKLDPQGKGDQYRHRFLSAPFLQARSEEEVLNIFRRALAQDVHFYEELFRLETCRALLDADRRSERVTRLLASKDTEVNTAMELAMEELRQRESAQHDLQDLREENDRLRDEIYGLNSRVGAMQEQAAQNARLQAALDAVRTTAEYPAGPVAVARYYARVFGDRIAFTQRAWQSLETCTTRPEYLWEAFYHMATSLYDLLSRNDPQPEKAFKLATGWDCARSEGRMTRKDSRLMRQFEDVYDGRQICIESHVKNGSREADPRFVRIYYAYDPQVASQIIIGHCGRHLDNYSTPKARR